MKKDIGKGILTQSRLKNQASKISSHIFTETVQKQRHIVVKLTMKNKKKFLSNLNFNNNNLKAF